MISVHAISPEDCNTSYKLGEDAINSIIETKLTRWIKIYVRVYIINVLKSTFKNKKTKI